MKKELVILEQSMNKIRNFTAKQNDVEASTDRFYEKAAFGSIHFDGAGQGAAISGALDILERAQGRCMDYFMHTDEVESACDYLARQNAKTRPLTKRFWDGLAIRDQHTRFEATAQALRVIRQQFGE